MKKFIKDTELDIIPERPYEETLLHRNSEQRLLDPSLTEMKTFTVSSYADICEDYSMIKIIIPISYSYIKLFFFSILSILSFFIFNLLIVWFPRLKLIFLYAQVPLQDASFVAVIGVDNKIYFKDLNKKKVNHQIDRTHFLRTQYQTNIPFESNEIYEFQFKLFRYIYIPDSGTFEGVDFKLDTTLQNIHRKCSQGLSENEVEFMRNIFGECDLQIHIDSYTKLLYLEFSDPFYLFQIFSIILWYNDNYEYFATIIIFSTLLSLFTTAYDNRKTLILLHNVAKYSCTVNVLRHNENGEKKLKQISSVELVPGDLFEVPDNIAMPCDCLLLTGSVIVNEAMLTGENTPIFKNHLLRSKDYYIEEKGEKSFLFGGTKVLQKRSQNGEVVAALAHYTGFETWKGNLIRSIVFPKNEGTESRSDTMKYMIFMSFVYIFGLFIVLPILIHLNIPTSDVIIKSLDLATTTVPPSLPTCLGIGISFAISRLRKSEIICVNRDKVNTAGKVNMICLDKTGTLTEEDLGIYGFRPILLTKGDEFMFGNFSKSAKGYVERAYKYYKNKRLKKIKNKNEDINQLFVECLASCHTATMINDIVLGDPIDVKMFEASEWMILENNSDKDSIINTYLRPKNEKSLSEELEALNSDDDEEKVIKSHYELGVIRTFEFATNLQRMSVLVRDVNDDFFKVFSKGSPEQIRDSCLKETIPPDFNDVLKKYTMKGFRVLAFSYKNVKISYLESQTIKREKLENKMIFLGLLIVQNQLKPRTAETISILNKANIRLAMATGDYILTAISVARQCELINPESIVYNCEIIDNKLVWNHIEKFEDNDFIDENEVDEGKEFRLDTEEEEILLGINKSYTVNKKINITFDKELIEKMNKKEDKIKEENKNEEQKEGENNEEQNEEEKKNLEKNGIEKNGIEKNEIEKNEKEKNGIEKKEDKKEEEKKEEEKSGDNSKDNSIILAKTKITSPNLASKVLKDITIQITPHPPDLADRRNSFSFVFPPENFFASRKQSNTEDVNSDIPRKRKNEAYESSSSSDVSLLNIDIQKHPFKDSNIDNQIIAIRGNTFEYFFRLRNKYLETGDEKYKSSYETFQTIIRYGKIFARMGSSQKAMLVAALQDENLTVLMCGDGANDVAALRTADVGVSLTNEESSIAAPFNSAIDDISCLVKLLREGKCSLVTTIQTFKYMIVYSLIQFMTIVLLFMNNSYLTDFQFIIVDIFIILPLASLFPLTEPYRKLTKHQLTGNLVSFPIICSIFTQTLICLIFLVVGVYFLKKREWYKEPMCILTEKDVYECPENTVLYCISHMQYLITAFVFIISKPFKKRFYTNKPLTIFMFIIFIYSIFLIINPDSYSRKALSLFDFEDQKNHEFSDGYFPVVIFLITILNFGVSYVCEKAIVPSLTNCWYKRKMRILQEKAKDPNFELTLGQIQQINTI